MSPPMARGAAVAPLMAQVQRCLGWRGPRVPFADTALGEAYAAHQCAKGIRLRWNTRQWNRIFVDGGETGSRAAIIELGRADLALAAIENYYHAIGAAFDAQRVADMRSAVAWCLEDCERGIDTLRRCRHHAMWVGAFAKAFPDGLRGLGAQTEGAS